ncbi:MAG: carbohydrate kinase family protein [Faecalicatena sp.]|uniref:carbohydrate kinase family protein n=1 Tax=Faecalicatena sp. TaxID=2005360 RepID=UPI00258E90A1|nr:carbohydrate kinase family protein [Faecalicatena sp.]MCI6464667.1 carbohydrate kinase family protein [Faecalicatena sp.]MDY5618245.1 carbohydrate kinase family protein [Lachnospiraceae bacterium]
MMQHREKLRKKAICAGHICLDITPAFHNQRYREIGELLIPGRLIDMDKASVSLGGSVANTGIGMKLLGCDVEVLGKIGKDAFGQIVRRELEKYGIRGQLMIQSAIGNTSYSVILAPAGIDRIILHHAGANHEFVVDDLNLEEIKKADLFHFGYPPLMRSMYRENGKEMIRLLKTIHNLGTAISVDMAMFEEDAEAGHQDWNRILKEALPYIDFFLPSIEELCMMLDRERYHTWLQRAEGRDITEVLNIEEDVRPLADQLLSYGAKIVLIKCGSPGIYLRTASRGQLLSIQSIIKGEDVKAWADKEIFEPSYRVEKVVSGTGAGDTTIAAFLASILEGYSCDECLHLAAAAGAVCVGTYDALSGMVPLTELKKKIDSGWEKNNQQIITRRYYYVSKSE